mgnify:FL=1
MRGPIDYLIVGFDGNKFTGEILRELQTASDAGIISVLALALVSKDENGVVTTVALDEDTLEITSSFNLDDTLVSDDDVSEVGELLENNTAAGLLVVEQLWAKGLKQAIVNAGGFLIADGRIHPEAAEELSNEEEA